MALVTSPGIFDAAIGNQRDIGFAGRLAAFRNGGELRYSGTGDDTRGADRARSDPHFDAVHAQVDQFAGGFIRSDIAGDERMSGIDFLTALTASMTRSLWA